MYIMLVGFIKIVVCFFSHFSSDSSRQFMRDNIDNLEQPEEHNKMAVPGLCSPYPLYY